MLPLFLAAKIIKHKRPYEECEKERGNCTELLSQVSRVCVQRCERGGRASNLEPKVWTKSLDSTLNNCQLVSITSRLAPESWFLTERSEEFGRFFLQLYYSGDWQQVKITEIHFKYLPPAIQGKRLITMQEGSSGDWRLQTRNQYMLPPAHTRL